MFEDAAFYSIIFSSGKNCAILPGDEDRRPVRGERLILREQENRLHEALPEQRAVERIVMVLRKIGNARRATGGISAFSRLTSKVSTSRSKNFQLAGHEF